MLSRIPLINEFHTKLDSQRGTYMDVEELRVWFAPDNDASRFLVTKGFKSPHAEPVAIKIGIILNWLFFKRIRATSNGNSNVFFLMKALKNNFNDDLLEALIIQGAHYQAGADFLGFKLTGHEIILLFAALTSYEDHLLALIKCLPGAVRKILLILDYIQDGGSSNTKLIYFEIDGKRWDLREKSELRDNFLNTLELSIDSQITAANSISVCCHIYQSYLASTEAKVPRSLYNCLNYFSHPVYAEKKIQQIGALQEKILNLAKGVDTEVCLALFNHDIFSSKHNQFGVDKRYRASLEKMTKPSLNLEIKNTSAAFARIC